MPGGRPRKDLDQHKDWLVERVAAGITRGQILKDLEAQHGMNVSVKTLNRQLREWEMPKRTVRDKWEDSEELRARVAECFHVLKLTDDATQKQLEEEGFKIGKRRLARLRKDMGLFKRFSAEGSELAEGAVAKALLQEIKSGGVEHMGRKKLYSYLRAKYNVIGRDRVYKIANLFDPDGPKRRHAQSGRDAAKRRANKNKTTLEAAAEVAQEPQMALPSYALPGQTRLEAAAEILQEPQMALPSYPLPQLHMPLHYGM